MNTRVDELKKEIKHLNIDRSKCVDEREQLSPAMEASVSTYSRISCHINTYFSIIKQLNYFMVLL